MPNLKCIVENCRTGKNVTIFPMPENEELEKLWLTNIGMDNFVISKSSGICENHFDRNQIIRSVRSVNGSERPKWTRLKKGAVPKVDNDDGMNSTMESTRPGCSSHLITKPCNVTKCCSSDSSSGLNSNQLKRKINADDSAIDLKSKSSKKSKVEVPNSPASVMSSLNLENLDTQETRITPPIEPPLNSCTSCLGGFFCNFEEMIQKVNKYGCVFKANSWKISETGGQLYFAKFIFQHIPRFIKGIVVNDDLSFHSFFHNTDVTPGNIAKLKSVLEIHECLKQVEQINNSADLPKFMSNIVCETLFNHRIDPVAVSGIAQKLHDLSEKLKVPVERNLR